MCLEPPVLFFNSLFHVYFQDHFLFQSRMFPIIISLAVVSNSP